MGGHLGVTEASGHGSRDHEDGAQRERTDQQRNPGLGAGADTGRVRSQRGAVSAGAPHHDDHVDGGHPALGDDRSPGGSGDAESGAVDQPDVQGRVDGEAADGDVQRCPGVLEAAQYTGGRQHHEHRRDAEGADAQVGDGVRGGGGRGAEDVDEPGRGGQDGGQYRGAQQQGEPDTVHALPDGGRAVTGTDPPGDGGGGGVREEDEDRDRGRQQRGGDAEPGELPGAEVADDGAVDHDEERFRDERAEGGQSERDDLAVVAAVGAPRRRGGLCHAVNLIFHR